MRKKHILVTALAIVAAVGAGYFIFSQQNRVPEYSLSTIDIADTEEERVQGLSGRDALADDYGMLFKFDTPARYGFWMKDMLIPIDMIWLSDNGRIVAIHQNVEPDTFPTAFHPPSPVRYVLEVRANLAEDRGWEVGTNLSLPIP